MIVVFPPASIDSSLVSTDSFPVSRDYSLLAFMWLELSPYIIYWYLALSIDHIGKQEIYKIAGNSGGIFYCLFSPSLPKWLCPIYRSALIRSNIIQVKRYHIKIIMYLTPYILNNVFINLFPLSLHHMGHIACYDTDKHYVKILTS